LLVGSCPYFAIGRQHSNVQRWPPDDKHHAGTT
jgi:hypothetical protein